MGLVSRLSGLPEEGQSQEDVQKIGFDFLVSAMAERYRGKISAQGIAQQFNLDAQEQTQAQALYTKLTNLANNAQRESFLNEIRQILSLAEMGFDDSANGNRNYGLLADVQARINEL